MSNEVYDLNLYKVFYVCAYSKSFSEAANKLLITQPAVSYSIKTLESQLNVELFNRTYNGISLSNEGKALLFYVEKANNSLKSGTKIIEELVNKEISIINIGVPTHIGAYYLIKFLKMFNDKYPNIKINIVDKKTSEMIPMIESKELDLLLDTDLTELADNNISIMKLKDFKGIFVGNKTFETLSNKNIVSSKELSTYPIILPNQNTNTRKLIDTYFRRKNILLKPIAETNSSPIAKNLIESGIGIGWMISDFVQEDVDSKK